MAIHLTIYMKSGEIGGSFSIWKEDKLIYIQTRNQFQGNEKWEKIVHVYKQKIAGVCVNK